RAAQPLLLAAGERPAGLAEPVAYLLPQPGTGQALLDQRVAGGAADAGTGELEAGDHVVVDRHGRERVRFLEHHAPYRGEPRCTTPLGTVNNGASQSVREGDGSDRKVPTTARNPTRRAPAAARAGAAVRAYRPCRVPVTGASCDGRRPLGTCGLMRTVKAGLAVAVAAGLLIVPGTALGGTADGTPGAAHRFDIQAHRGGIGLRVESTLASFGNALKLGVTTLELDVQIT